jgi:GNAT superfamily N-acetyltransferase
VKPETSFQIRKAVSSDIPILESLIQSSVRELQAHDYTPSQLESALASVYGVDTLLIDDGTYLVAEANDPAAPTEANAKRLVVGCGGWSKRKTLYGGDRWAKRQDQLLDPLCDAAKIRAFFVHPAWVRRGIGSMILDACETAAKAAGFVRFEMGATLSGVPLHRAREYVEVEELEVPLANGESLKIIHMSKE